MPKKLENDRFLRALHCQPVDVTPIWLMRQAGRYLPEYCKLRQEAGDFLTLCKTPSLACEVTLQPIRRFDLDAAILFSDILTIPDAMGLGLYFQKDEGPRFRERIDSGNKAYSLKLPDMKTNLSYVYEAVDRIKTELNQRIPLIGFSGSPWTLATYMVEGQGSKDFRGIKRFLYQEPEALHALLETLSIAVSEYLYHQIKAGVDAVQIFDTWGGVLSPGHYRAFSLQYMQKIIVTLREKLGKNSVPIILFTKNAYQWLEEMIGSETDCLGIDWTVSINSVREKVNGRCAIQGNLDPAVLYASKEAIRIEVERILAEFGPYSGHIFNLGHGMLRDVDPANVEFLVNCVHDASRYYHNA